MIVIATKRCGKCRKFLPTEDFHAHRGESDGLQPHCKSCKKQYHSAYYPKNKGRFREARKKYAATESGRAALRAYKSRHRRLNKSVRVAEIRRKYGVDGLFAERLVDVPVCQSCGYQFPHRGDERIDHCHENSHVRGVVCQLCNIAMAGPAKQCIDRLRGCINYLERDAERQSLEASCPD